MFRHFVSAAVVDPSTRRDILSNLEHEIYTPGETYCQTSSMRSTLQERHIVNNDSK